MQCALLFVLCAAGAALAAPDIIPVQLLTPLPAMAEFAAGAVPKEIVTEYHAPFGIPEAMRIAQSELAVPESEVLPDGAAVSQDQKPEVMIVGGLRSFRGEHPFMAGLVVTLTSGSTSVCGGSLVTSTRVLTAASCYWDGVNQAYSVLVVLGSVTLFSGGNRVHAPSIAVHPMYSPSAVHNDIAVLTIPYQSPTTYIRPIRLASGSDQYDGIRAEVIGFGRTSNTASITSSASMRDLYVNVMSNAACANHYGVVTASVMCSSGAGGKNPCGGDQGGPLIIYSSAGNDVLLGVFTFGSTRGCEADDPAGYMRVSYFYYWIQAQL